MYKQRNISGTKFSRSWSSLKTGINLKCVHNFFKQKKLRQKKKKTTCFEQSIYINCSVLASSSWRKTAHFKKCNIQRIYFLGMLDKIIINNFFLSLNVPLGVQKMVHKFEKMRKPRPIKPSACGGINKASRPQALSKKT